MLKNLVSKQIFVRWQVKKFNTCKHNRSKPLKWTWCP